MGVAFLALDPKDWLIDLSAIDLIAGADLNGLQNGLAYLTYIILAQSLLLIPLVYSLVSPVRAQSTLAR